MHSLAAGDGTALRWLQQAWDRPRDALATCPPLRPDTAPHRRLVDALAQHPAGVPLGPKDLAALLRGVLLSETVGTQGAVRVPVPRTLIDKIGEGALSASSLVVHSYDERFATVSARPWSPSWLASEEHDSPERPLYTSEPRRRDPPMSGDASLQAFGWTSYSSRAQQAAIRCVLSAPPGSTVLVNLPTGSGKSLCALLPSVMPLDGETETIGVTPVVVPTVALALDLDARSRERVGHATAYRPGTQEASEIAARSRAGVQGPVYLAPEALVGSMAKPLSAAATAGLLKMFVVDEAHMVTAWGDDFRPAFQQIAASRAALLAESPRKFVTVLMSATLTAYSQDALYSLFASPGPVRQLHAVRLRPEPSYWIREAGTEDQRTRWVDEVLSHMPRPLILYVTRRQDAVKWRDRLRQQGYRRVGMMHGDTPDDERAQLLEAWTSDQIDVVVATSAFGLGVDKQDVRCVVHATCPEDVDRFYQDVGRGGRDGFASVSIVLWTAADMKLARSLAIPTFIGIERGAQRWRAMFVHKVESELPDLHYDVPLDVSPGGNAADIDMSNDENTRWNLRTLLLMARAGMIDIHGARIEEGTGRQLITVGIHDLEHLEDARWAETVDPLRDRLLASNKAAWEELKELLAAKDCFARHFQKAYAVEDRDITVVRACGGCPTCRHEGAEPTCGRLTPRLSPSQPWPTAPIDTALAALVGSKRLGLVFHPDHRADSEAVRRLISWACSQRVRNVVVPNTLRARWSQFLSQLGRRPLFLHASLPRDSERLQPMAIVSEGMTPAEWTVAWRFLVGAADALPPTLLVLPEGARDPLTDRLLRDTVYAYPKMSIAQWQEAFDE